VQNSASSAGGCRDRPRSALSSMLSNRRSTTGAVPAGRSGAPQGSRQPGRLDPLHRALAEAGIEPSVGSVGDSYDNALAETVIGLFKTEVIRRCGPWRQAEAVEFATLEWVDWFNHRRLLEPIGNIPPAEAEARYYAQIAGQAMAA
jgi:transposase InsO family protein